MRYEIYDKDNALVNRIEASEEFAHAYCERNGYTYAEVVEPTPEPEPEPTVYDELAAAYMEGVNEA